MTRDEWTAKLQGMSDDDLRKACNQYIWLSAYANNNPRSDYHWMCDATWEEGERRGKPEFYTEEHAKLVRQAKGERA